MNFYHYATAEFPDLRSRLAQGKGKLFIMDRLPDLLNDLQGSLAIQLDKVRLGGEWSYDRSISLFLEPIPLDIASIYKGKHEFWQSGLELVQYELSINQLPAGIAWRLSESPEKTRLLYEKQDWEAAKEDKSLIAKYVKEIKDKEKAMGYVGHGHDSLCKIVKRFNRKTRHYTEEAAKIAEKFPEDGGFKKYAACVPHLMIYPGYKPIEYDNVKTIKLK